MWSVFYTPKVTTLSGLVCVLYPPGLVWSGLCFIPPWSWSGRSVCVLYPRGLIWSVCVLYPVVWSGLCFIPPWSGLVCVLYPSGLVWSGLVWSVFYTQPFRRYVSDVHLNIILILMACHTSEASELTLRS